MIQRAVIRIPERRYYARIDRWVDGDTVVFTTYLGSWIAPIKLGFGFTHVIADEFEGAFRLFGINAPEKYKEGGSEATQFAEDLLPVGSIVEILASEEPDSFGRYVAEIYLKDETTFSETMIAAGHAVIYTERRSLGEPRLF